jgi:hypothetical protein
VMLSRPGLGTLTALLLAAAMGCSPGARPEPTPPAPAQPRSVVVCVDRSLSYHYTAEVLAAFADLLVRLPREDAAWTLHFRWVAENSYEPGAQIMTVNIPPLPPRPKQDRPSNPFDRREAELRRQELASYEARVREIVERAAAGAQALTGVPWVPARGSDIWGCFMKAAELLHGGGWVAIGSDMEPFGPQQRAALDLKGIRVHVVFFEAADARRAQALKQTWVAWLTEAGAEEVVFHDPSRGLADFEKALGVVVDGRP